MANPLDPSYRNTIMTKLTLQIADAIKEGSFPEDQLPQVCKDVLDTVQTPTTAEEFLSSVENLTVKWPIFAHIRDDMKKKAQAFHDVDTMFDRNKPNEHVQT